MQLKVSQQVVIRSFLLAISVAFAREVGAGNAHTDIIYAESIGRGECLYQQVVSVLGCHLHQIVTGRVGESKTEAVHRLVLLFGIQRNDAVGCTQGRADFQLLRFQQNLTVGTCCHHLNSLFGEGAKRSG